MRGKPLIMIFGIFVVIFALALWWFQTRAYYTVRQDVTVFSLDDGDIAVEGYEGIDARTSPIKLRECFRLPPESLARVEALPDVEGATPLVAPDWFDCFDARALQDGLEAGPDAGGLRVVRAARNIPWGADRMLAFAPDGRAWSWRQLNECGDARYNGDPQPEGCGEAPEG